MISLPFKILIFHSYVQWPEGNTDFDYINPFIMSQPEQFFKNPGSSHRSSPIAMAICVRSRCGEMNIPMGPMGPINQITSCHITFIGSFVGPGGFFPMVWGLYLTIPLSLLMVIGRLGLDSFCILQRITVKRVRKTPLNQLATIW